jgi:predicted anti-sigma-YlaC factor YlaD
MPNINVTERRVRPRYDTGLLNGLIVGAVMYVWIFFIGLLSSEPLRIWKANAAFMIGDDAFGKASTVSVWLLGSVVHFIGAALVGLLFAALWPTLRKKGTWAPSILFALGCYLLIYIVIGNFVFPRGAGINQFALLTAFFIGGATLAWRYRRS